MFRFSEEIKVSIKIKKKFSRGVVHIKATFNNTLVCITNKKGQVISWSSAGSCGFKGTKKSTAFAAQVAAESASKKAMESGLRQVEIIISGPGAGRESSIRAIQMAGFGISIIRDITPIPHNGCRPPKRRRV